MPNSLVLLIERVLQSLNLKPTQFSPDCSQSLVDITSDYLISQKGFLGDPALSWSEDDSILGVTYYSPLKSYKTVEDFITILKNISSYNGMESFKVLPFEVIADTPIKRIYAFSVEFSPPSLDQSITCSQKLEIQLYHHWKIKEHR